MVRDQHHVPDGELRADGPGGVRQHHRAATACDGGPGEVHHLMGVVALVEVEASGGDQRLAIADPHGPGVRTVAGAAEPGEPGQGAEVDRWPGGTEEGADRGQAGAEHDQHIVVLDARAPHELRAATWACSRGSVPREPGVLVGTRSS